MKTDRIRLFGEHLQMPQTCLVNELVVFTWRYLILLSRRDFLYILKLLLLFVHFIQTIELRLRESTDILLSWRLVGRVTADRLYRLGRLSRMLFSGLTNEVRSDHCLLLLVVVLLLDRYVEVYKRRIE